MAEQAESVGKGAEIVEQPKRSLIQFHYIKGNFFHVVHADGVVGGPGPSADSVRVSFYNDRVPLPIQVTNEISDAGLPGAEVGRVARQGIVREVEVEVIMPPEVAREIGKFIIDAAEAAEEARLSNKTEETK